LNWLNYFSGCYFPFYSASIKNNIGSNNRSKTNERHEQLFPGDLFGKIMYGWENYDAIFSGKSGGQEAEFIDQFCLMFSQRQIQSGGNELFNFKS
jgi:hypothetical protein